MLLRLRLDSYCFLCHDHNYDDKGWLVMTMTFSWWRHWCKMQRGINHWRGTGPQCASWWSAATLASWWNNIFIIKLRLFHLWSSVSDLAALQQSHNLCPGILDLEFCFLWLIFSHSLFQFCYPPPIQMTAKRVSCVCVRKRIYITSHSSQSSSSSQSFCHL